PPSEVECGKQEYLDDVDEVAVLAAYLQAAHAAASLRAGELAAAVPLRADSVVHVHGVKQRGDEMYDVKKMGGGLARGVLDMKSRPAGNKALQPVLAVFPTLDQQKHSTQQHNHIERAPRRAKVAALGQQQGDGDKQAAAQQHGSVDGSKPEIGTAAGGFEC